MKQQQRKVNIDFNIRQVTIKVDQPMEVLVLWKRSKNVIDTKVRELVPGEGQQTAIFNEKFQMKTQLDYDTLKRIYVGKKSDLQLWKKDMTSMLGVAEFDLSKYVNDISMSDKTQEDRLPLKNCLIDQNAFLDILIKAKVDPSSISQSSPSSKMNSGRNAANSSNMFRLPTIAERESESDLKEELDRKEREYEKKITRLNSDVEILRKSRDQALLSHAEMKLKMIKKGGDEMLSERENTIRDMKRELISREEDANILKMRNQLVVEMVVEEGYSEGIKVSDIEKQIRKYMEKIDQESRIVEAMGRKVDNLYSMDKFF